MRPFFVSLFAAIAALTVGVADLWAHGEEEHQDSAVEYSAAEQEVVGALELYAQAMESADFGQLTQAFTADDQFTYYEGTHLDVGWEAYKTHVEPEMKLFRDTSYTVSNIRPQLGQDMAYVTFDYAMDVTIVSDQFEGGVHPVSMKGVGTAILKRMDEVWKISHLHTTQKRDKAPSQEQQNPEGEDGE